MTRNNPLVKRDDHGGRRHPTRPAGTGSKKPPALPRRRAAGLQNGAGKARTDAERERERMERKCEEYRQRALAAEREQAEILTVVSHDLRNPLSAILVSVRLLARAVPEGAEGRRQLEAIQRAAEEINHVIQDLIDATSIETSSLMLAAKPCEAASLVEAALAAVGPAAAQKPLTLNKEFLGDVPRVLADRDRAVQALSNLLGNAVKFTPKGGTITVRTETTDAGALFSITDTGPGIPGDVIPQLFDKYAPRRGPSSQGVGLAVFVAKGIIDAHGGRMWAENRPGGGSAFFFTLPAV